MHRDKLLGTLIFKIFWGNTRFPRVGGVALLQHIIRRYRDEIVLRLLYNFLLLHFFNLKTLIMSPRGASCCGVLACIVLFNISLFSMCVCWFNIKLAKLIKWSKNKYKTSEWVTTLLLLNPLTPVPPVTARDETWPFFLFWRHNFDQNWHHLYSTSAGGKDLSKDAQIRVIGRMEPFLDMHKNAQKVEWKTRSKISCYHTWLLHAKNCPSRSRFLRSFFNRKQAQ